MTGLAIACFSIVAIGLAAVALGLARIVGLAKFRTGRQRLKGFSVFDLQLTVGSKGAEAPKTEAAVYFTIKTLRREPNTAAKMLFDEKVRHLGE